MKRKLISVLCSVILVVLSSIPLRAGARARVRFIGMSADGRYLAYEASGVQDGSGFPWCTIQVMDTKSNRPAADPVHVTDNDDKMVYSPAEVVKACRTLALPLLDRHGILDRIRGERVFRAPHTRADHLPARRSAAFFHRGTSFTLELVQTPLRRSCGLDNTPQLLALRLTARKAGKPLQTVHRETTIPAHRGNGCPLGYGIAKLYVAGSRLVVHLDMATPGFEGPDINPAFVVLTLP